LNGQRFDNLTRAVAADGMSRRTTLKAAALGGATALFGSRFTEDAEASTCQGLCAHKNWCENRTQTCGPPGSHGKCFVKRFGGNFCAEILFQTQTCSDCNPPNCTGCRCILGAGGGDKCNNGVNGFDYICVRPIAPPSKGSPGAADLGERRGGMPTSTNPVRAKHRAL
jgi:hypothetical protein